MREHDGLNEAERDWEAGLRSLKPAAAQLDPVAAAFDAGRRARGMHVRFWRLAAVLMLGLGAMGWITRGIDPEEQRAADGRVTVVIAPPPQVVSDQSMLRLRQAVWDRGVEGLPAAHVPAVRTIDASRTF